jgi:signal transduction histidine kinase
MNAPDYGADVGHAAGAAEGHDAPGQTRLRQLAEEERDGCLHLSIRDDGAGGADPARGSGLIGLRDRVEALGGSLEVSSPPGQGTLILVNLPLRLH